MQQFKISLTFFNLGSFEPGRVMTRGWIVSIMFGKLQVLSLIDRFRNLCYAAKSTQLTCLL